MTKFGAFNVAVAIACGAWALLIAVASPSVAEDWHRKGQTPADIFEDGLEAISDHATDAARRILAGLIADYPSSPEASRARHVLATLGADPGEERAAIRADAAERTAEYRRAFLLDAGDRVFFAESSSTIGGRARGVIENQARWLKLRPDLTVTIIGRADDGGSRDAARSLSLERATSVRDRLVAAGIAAERIGLRASGDEDRLATCRSSLCQAQNRNAEVYINDLRGDTEWQSSQQTTPPGQGTSIGTTPAAPR